MRIEKVNVYEISLLFSGDFSHSRNRAYSSKNILVEVITDHGEIKGYGEGAPRPYVTGETQGSAANSIIDLINGGQFPWELDHVTQIWDFIDNQHSGKDYNSAICALEMSLLDLLAKGQNRSIIEFFTHDFLTHTIYYGGAIGLEPKDRIIELCQLFEKLNMNRLKLKMGRDYEKNRDLFKLTVSTFRDDYDLKIDVNGVWDGEIAIKHVPLIREYRVKVVEQPMMPGDPDIARFAKIMKDEGVVLMADESACSLDDVKNIVNEGHYKMVNVRLSKCGGFRRSLRIIDYLRENGLSFQIAAHLGESGLLSAAGRALSLLCGDAVYYDGSYDEFLLKENITTENVTFGIGGKAGPLDGPGLGVRVSEKSLRRLSDISSRITINKP